MARLDTGVLIHRPATLGVLLFAGALSVLRFAGYRLDFLIDDYPEWRQEPWRLVTTTLLHASALHLLFNLYWTAVFGALVEGVLGPLATAGLYVVLAASSSAAEAAVFSSGIGLSGVGYGLFGFLWAAQRSDARFAGTVDRSTSVLFVAWFFFCIATTVTGALPVANVAHGAGAVLGGLVGLGVTRVRAHGPAAFLPAAGLALLVALACTVGRPWVKVPSALAREYGQDGIQALEAGENERAAEILARAARVDPDEVTNWWNLGVAQWRLGLFQEASESFNRAGAPEEEDLPILIDAKLQLADQARDEGRAEDAQELLRAVLELDPLCARALSRLALLREAAGDVDDAIDLYQRALEAGSDEPWTRDNLERLKGQGR